MPTRAPRPAHPACSTARGADLLRTLKERSEANRGARKKELEDRYCMRQVGLSGGQWVGGGSCERELEDCCWMLGARPA